MKNKDGKDTLEICHHENGEHANKGSKMLRSVPGLRGLQEVSVDERLHKLIPDNKLLEIAQIAKDIHKLKHGSQ